MECEAVTISVSQRTSNRERERRTVVTRLIETATHRFVEPEFAQLIALFEAWRQEIDSEPFAHEGDWVTVDSPVFDVVSTWTPRQPDTTPDLEPFA